VTPGRSYDYLWLSLGLLPLLGVALLLPVPAQDYWWYLRLGQETLKAGAVPAIDTLSYSRAGMPVFYQAWLAGVIFQVIYDLGGATLTFLLRGVLIGVTYGLLWAMLRRESGPRLASVLVILVGLSTANNWTVRPQLFAYPLFVLCVWVLHGWQDGRSRLLWILPLSTLLWVNLHGSFVLLFPLAGAALLFGKGDRRSLLVTLLAMLAATFINPHGAGVWGYLAFMLNSPSDYLFSVEWGAPGNYGWQMHIFFGWLLAFAPLAALSPRRLSLVEWTWFLGFGWLALSGVRYVIWFHMLVALFSARLLSAWTNERLDRPAAAGQPAGNFLLGTLILLLPLAILPGLRASWWKEAPPLYELATTPLAAVDWLRAHPELPGPLWNEYAFGSYLEFALPERPTWIDTRMFNFPAAQWDEYVRASGGAPGWQAALDRSGANLLLLSTASQPALINAAGASGAWCEQYRDAYAVILARCSVAP
jgi:hypothetical protein